VKIFKIDKLKLIFVRIGIELS